MSRGQKPKANLKGFIFANFFW